MLLAVMFSDDNVYNFLFFFEIIFIIQIFLVNMK